MDNAPFALQPTAIKEIKAIFNPQLNFNELSDTLRITSNAFNAPQISINLTGFSIQAPAVNIPQNRTLYEDMPAVVFTDLDSFVIEEDGQSVNWSIVQFDDSLLDSVKLSVGNGCEVFPKANLFGQAWIKFLAIDSDNLSDEDSVNIVINPANDAPFFTNIPAWTTAYVDSVFNYLINADDIDIGDILQITVVDTLPLWLNLTDNGDGTANLSGTPDNSDIGGFDIQFMVSDAAVATDIQTLNIVVQKYDIFDVNDDGIVDIFDVQIIAGKRDVGVGNPNYQIAMDFNRDGVIDEQDLEMLIREWRNR